MFWLPPRPNPGGTAVSDGSWDGAARIPNADGTWQLTEGDNATLWTVMEPPRHYTPNSTGRTGPPVRSAPRQTRRDCVLSRQVSAESMSGVGRPRTARAFRWNAVTAGAGPTTRTTRSHRCVACPGFPQLPLSCRKARGVVTGPALGGVRRATPKTAAWSLVTGAQPRSG